MSGMRETLPADLDQALIDLEADAPTPSAFERVARWRRACGDAESAAEWQTWSLLPPEQADLRTALAGVATDPRARARRAGASLARGFPCAHHH